LPDRPLAFVVVDLISEAVTTTRAGRAVAVRNRHVGSWATRFPAVNGSGLHVVRQGTPWLIPDGGRPVPLGRGSIVFVPRGVPHGFSSGPMSFSDLPAVRERPPELLTFDVDFVSCCYHLDRGRAHASFDDLPDVITTVLDENGYPALRTLADLLGEHAANPGPGNDIALPAVVDLLLVHLLRMWRDQEGADSWPAIADARIAEALRLVRENPRRPMTVQQMSDAVHMSRAAFTRRFTEVTGERPGAYLLRRRLDLGAQLLRRTDLPLASIAQQVGYATEFSFSAAFRREFGIAPGRFRNHERTSETSS
jgi:AraC-like DNA-binding protein